MNELATISDLELAQRIEQVKERELAIQAEAGRKFLAIKMRELIMYLEKVGYKIDADELALAQLWANTLGEEYVRLGEEGMKQAVVYWVAHDNSEYRAFPKVPWIKEACSQIGGDPRAEQGRRIQAEAERKMKEEHRREMEAFAMNHPDIWARIQKQAEEMDRRYICKEAGNE